MLLALAVTALSCVAQEKLTSDESNSIHTYTPTQYIKQVEANPQDGMIVRIKFNGRAPSLSNGPDGTKVGHLEGRDMSNYNYEVETGLAVEIPPAGFPWFQHLAVFTWQTFDRLAIKSYIVYGRVKVGSSGKASVRLLGTEIKHDLDGDSIDWGEPASAPTP